MPCHFCGGPTPCACTASCRHCGHIGHEHSSDGTCRGSVFDHGEIRQETCEPHIFEEDTSYTKIVNEALNGTVKSVRVMTSGGSVSVTGVPHTRYTKIVNEALNGINPIMAEEAQIVAHEFEDPVAIRPAVVGTAARALALLAAMEEL